MKYFVYLDLSGKFPRWRSIRNDDPRYPKIMDILAQSPPKYPTFRWPTEYPGGANVTQAFGINPQFYEPLGVPAHEGIDMKAPMRSKIFACWDGEVSRNNNTQHPAYGWSVRLKHIINGVEYESVYGHFVERSRLEKGALVKKGDVIGFADSTGNSTGTHLHFSLKQMNGQLPDTEAQKKYGEKWKTLHGYIIDPTPFFAELR